MSFSLVVGRICVLRRRVPLRPSMSSPCPADPSAAAERREQLSLALSHEHRHRTGPRGAPTPARACRRPSRRAPGARGAGPRPRRGRAADLHENGVPRWTPPPPRARGSLHGSTPASDRARPIGPRRPGRPIPTPARRRRRDRPSRCTQPARRRCSGAHEAATAAAASSPARVTSPSMNFTARSGTPGTEDITAGGDPPAPVCESGQVGPRGRR